MGQPSPRPEVIHTDTEHNIVYVCEEDSHPGRPHSWRQEEVVKLYPAGDGGDWIRLPDFDKFFRRVSLPCPTCGEKFWFPLRVDQQGRETEFTSCFVAAVAERHPEHGLWEWQRPA